MLDFLFTFFAGFFDAIIGGGGLITVPLLEIKLGNFSEALATNKILALMTCLFGYISVRILSKQKIKRELLMPALIAAMLGSLAGSGSVLISQDLLLKTLFTTLVPVILYLIFKKDLWISSHTKIVQKKNTFLSLFLILVCGYYDGLMGPGSGILFFLVFLAHYRLPTLESIMLTKLILSVTCSVALIHFSLSGLVNWRIGTTLTPTLILGTIIGSFFVTRLSHQIIRPILTIVAIGILIKAWL